MSIINTMLKDLEERKEKSADSSDASLAGLSAVSSNDSFKTIRENPYTLSLISVIAIFVIAGFVYFLSPYTLTRLSEAMPGSSAEEFAEIKSTAQKIMPEADNPLVDASPEQEINHSLNNDKEAPVFTKNKGILQEEKISNVAIEDSVTEEYAVQYAVQEEHIETRIEEDTVSVGSMNQKAQKNRQTVATTNLKAAMNISAPRQSKYQLALEHFNHSDTQNAKILLWEILKASPDNLEALKLLSLIYLQHGQFNLAKETVSKALLKNPSNQGLLRIYLKVCIKSEDYIGAIQIMNNAGMVSSPEDEAYLAGLYQKIDDHKNAIGLYTSALTSKPGNSIWWMGKGISLEALMMNIEALEAYHIAKTLGGLTMPLKDYVNQRIHALENIHGVN